MNLRNIYDSRRIWKVALITVSLLLVTAFLYISNRLAHGLAVQERERMEIWANATKELASAGPDTDVDFLLSIIESNHNIPLMLVDEQDTILLHRNFRLPEPVDSNALFDISPANLAFLQKKLDRLRNSNHKIEIKIDATTTQWLYYDDSFTLRQLAWFPYIQLAVMLIMLGIAYFALISVKRAEQNKVWVGVDKDVVADMDKDVHRLSVIADRFSKIGSMPEKELAFINEAVQQSLSYMSTRIPKRVTLGFHTTDNANCGIMLCQPLFEWVMENLTKNAVDAMGGEGQLDITVTSTTQQALILVRDTGKGIPRKNFKDVFNPGFTTKKRGWGLGLTLVKRIIEEYHGGRIYVKDSELGKGTTFAIELPIVGIDNG